MPLQKAGGSRSRNSSLNQNSISVGGGTGLKGLVGSDSEKITNYFVYHNTFAAPNVKVDFIGNTQ